MNEEILVRNIHLLKIYKYKRKHCWSSCNVETFTKERLVTTSVIGRYVNNKYRIQRNGKDKEPLGNKEPEESTHHQQEEDARRKRKKTDDQTVSI